MFAQGDYKEL